MSETYFIREKKERNYTILDNTFIKDISLSWKAKGVMTYLLSLPEDWKIYLSEIKNHATDGKDSLSSAIKELIEHGYLIFEQKKNEKGQFCGTVYRIVENPKTEKPLSAKTESEKPTLQNTNKQNTKDIQNTDNNIPETEKSVSAPAPKKQKHKHGEYQNVLLTDEEVEKLKTDYGEEKTEQAIQYLSEAKEMKGYTYKSDYLALKKWVFNALEEKSKPKYQNNNPLAYQDEEWSRKLHSMTKEEIDNLF